MITLCNHKMVSWIVTLITSLFGGSDVSQDISPISQVKRPVAALLTPLYTIPMIGVFKSKRAVVLVGILAGLGIELGPGLA